MSEPRALQAERTVLAWSRTVLTVTAAAALIARTADSGFERGAAVTLAAVGLVVALLTSTRRRHAITDGDRAIAPGTSALGGLLAAVAALVAAGIVVIL